MRRRITEQFPTVGANTRDPSGMDMCADFPSATTPSCPQGIMQFQHGSIVKNDDGSLSLTPIDVDGRQLQSDPCSYSHSVYTRYNQTETMKVSMSIARYSVDVAC